MDKQQNKAKAVAFLPGDVEIYPRSTGEDDTVELVVVTETGEQRPVRCALRPAVANAKAA